MELILLLLPFLLAIGGVFLFLGSNGNHTAILSGIVCGSFGFALTDLLLNDLWMAAFMLSYLWFVPFFVAYWDYHELPYEETENRERAKRGMWVSVSLFLVCAGYSLFMTLASLAC